MLYKIPSKINAAKAKAATLKLDSRDIPADLELQGTCELQAAEGDGKPKLYLSANSGVPMNLEGFFDPVIIDLNGARFFKAKTPIIADHDTRLRIGHSTEQLVIPAGTTKNIAGKQVKGPEIVAAGIVSSGSQVATGIVNDAKDGFPFEVSVGARIKKAEFCKEDDKVEVNGRTWKGPLIVARSTLIRELSITVLGADGSTAAKIAATLRGDSNMEFETWLEELTGLKASEIEAGRLTKLKAIYAKEVGGDNDDDPPTPEPKKGKKGAKAPIKAKQGKRAPEDPPEPDEDDDDADDLESLRASHRANVAEDEERCDAIRAMFNDERFEDIEEVALSAKQKVTPNKLKAKAIKEGWTADRVELALLRAKRDTTTSFNIHVTVPLSDTPDIMAAAHEVALCRSLGVPAKAKTKLGEEYGVEHWYPAKVLEAADRKDVRNCTSLHSMLDMNLRLTGKSFHGNRRTPEFASETLQAAWKLQASGSGPFSTVSVVTIFENVGNKVLLAEYQRQDTRWRSFCGIQSLNDFRPHSFYRLTSHGYKKIPPTGEIKHGILDESKSQVQAETYGIMLGISRTHIINDDMDVLGRIPRDMGRSAALALELEVFKILLSAAMFSVPNGNLIDKVLGIDGLTLAAQTFSNQVDKHGRPLLMSPDRLLVGGNNEVLASTLMKDVPLIWQPGAAPVAGPGAMVQAANPHVGKYGVTSTPMLNNTAIRDMDGTALVNQSLTQWFMFLPPDVLAAVIVGFLNGKQVPVIESADSSFNTLGIQYRSYHDWGVGEGDYRAAVKSTGTVA